MPLLSLAEVDGVSNFADPTPPSTRVDFNIFCFAPLQNMGADDVALATSNT
jgi:hypothetical protein